MPIDFRTPAWYNIDVLQQHAGVFMSYIVWKNEISTIEDMLKTKTTKQIGEHYGVSKQRIYQVMQKFGLSTNNRKRKSFLQGKPSKYYWFNRMLTSKGIPKEERLYILENFDIPDNCPMLGIPLNYDGGSGEGWHGKTDKSPSIDQIRPSKGYTRDNIQIISWRANRIKNDSTPEELVKISQYMQKLL